MDYIEHNYILTTQDDADAVLTGVIDTAHGPMTLIAVLTYLSAVAGSPTAVTIDVNLTDGTTTKVPILASSIGTAAGTLRHVATDANKEDAVNVIPEVDEKASSPAYWRYAVDFNFTGGTTPTVTGSIVLRFAK